MVGGHELGEGGSAGSGGALGAGVGAERDVAVQVARKPVGVFGIHVSAGERGGETAGAHQVAGSEREVPVVESDLALLIYTSGTTGRPKGVMPDYSNLEAMCAMAVEFVGGGADDHCLLTLPLFHVNGVVVSILMPLRAGGRVTINAWFEPKSFLQKIESARLTYFSAVPTIYGMLMLLPPGATADTSSVRFAICGAAPACAELLTGFEQRFGIRIAEGYGLSEGTCASALNPPFGIRKPGRVGPALPGQRIELRDADGYLIVAGRTKEMIIGGGENIYTREIWDVLTGHPSVHEAAVVGAPDPKYGEIPLAFLSLRPVAEVSEDELRARV